MSQKNEKSEQTKVVRFGDIYQPEATRPTYRRAAELLGKDILIIDAEVRQGNFGDYLLVKAQEGQETFSFTVGAQAVITKILDAKKQGLLPMVGRIVTNGRRLDIV